MIKCLWFVLLGFFFFFLLVFNSERLVKTTPMVEIKSVKVAKYKIFQGKNKWTLLSLISDILGVSLVTAEILQEGIYV